MKKAMKQWKKWLFETARTEKWSDGLEVGQQDPKGEFDRAVPDFLRGNYRNGLKKALEDYFINGNIVRINKVLQSVRDRDDQRTVLAKDLIGIHNIYKNRNSYPNELRISDNLGFSGYMFNEQPRIKHEDPTKAIEPIVKMMSDIQMVSDYIKTGTMPQSINIKDVLRYYISQNISQEDIPQSPTSDRFSRQLGFTSDQLAMMNRAALLKKKRKG